MNPITGRPERACRTTQAAPSMHNEAFPPAHLLLFDGVCKHCNGLVRFIIRHDRKAMFRFAPLQSPYAARILARHGDVPNGTDTLVYIRHGQPLERSTAALYIARDLGWPWRAAYILILLPRMLRDAAYNLIARYRYRWAGRRQRCMVPGPEIRDRFVA